MERLKSAREFGHAGHEPIRFFLRSSMDLKWQIKARRERLRKKAGIAMDDSCTSDR